MTTLWLASRSASRQRLLHDAGVPFELVNAPVDEEAAKAALRADGLGARDLADALAELKALRGGLRAPAGTLVLGCDQTLELDDGQMVDKVATRAEAAALLARMGGRLHRLHCAAVIVEGGAPVWRHVETATLTMRAFSADFVEHYLDLDWDACRWCVGCYRIEGPGAQLFSRVTGCSFAIQGLPLLPLLAYLRTRELIPA
jgi:septum formation protein